MSIVSENCLRPASPFAGFEVLVIGDAILDIFVEGTSTRRCPEADDAPVIDQAGDALFFPGGAANVAANCSSLGARLTTLVGVLGDDCFAASVEDLLEHRTFVHRRTVRSRDRETQAKLRISADGKLLARVDRGSTGPIGADDEAEVIRRVAMAWPSAEVVIVADYAKGVMTPAVIGAIARLNRADRKTLVVDAKDLSKYRDCKPTAVTPNYREAFDLVADAWESGPDRCQTIAYLAPRIFARTGAAILAVTLDRDGVIAFDHEGRNVMFVPTGAPAVNTSGGGDTFTAAFALALGSGGNLRDSVGLAQHAADVVVARPHTATCTAAELAPIPPDAPTPGLVLATGCFDVLHAGHIRLLSEARQMGDRLVVGINSDASIRRLKGPSRPINIQAERKLMALALYCVDDVEIFEEDTPEALIARLKPAVYIKGGDYSRETLPEASLVEQLGGKVVIVPRLEGYSSSAIVERARCPDGRSSTAR